MSETGSVSWPGQVTLPAGSTSRVDRQFIRNIIILCVAVALFILPDPFTDILAIWLIGKAGLRTSLRAKNIWKMGLAERSTSGVTD